MVLASLYDTTGITWARRMKFKPRKSRCLILKKDRINQQIKLKVQSEEIPTIVDNPIKCLEKWFDATLKDTNRKIYSPQ